MINLAFEKTWKSKAADFNLEIDLKIEKGAFVTLYGPSGAGKTTILRILAGLIKPDRGYIEIDGETWYSSKDNVFLPPQKRNVGFVFQDYALFPNMTVLENLRFAQSKESRKEELEELLTIMEIKELVQRFPDSLSGGQKQKVALARALAQQPKILLLDEPLAALDDQIRSKLQDYILQAHKQFGLTTLLVSHDLGEILKLSDTAIKLDQGRIEKKGEPAELFMNKAVSGKFQMNGTVLSIEKQDIIYIVSVQVQNSIIKVVADSSDIVDICAGDLVVLASKAFNPIIYKVSEQK